MGPERSPGIRRAASSVLILAGIFALSYFGARPPQAKPADAPASEFSGIRAYNLLGKILEGDTPHPLGSQADDAIRTRILAELGRLGYQTQVQTAFDCDEFGNCATVNNVLARTGGTDKSKQGEAVLLAAHYDSVPAGPGAADDGSGVAVVLEIARVLKTLPPQRRSIILLIDEGEEMGLLGARAFVDWHPWAREVRSAVNLDARGTKGASLLFETGSANEWLVQLFKRSAARPVTSSIFYDVYEHLPNDTDMSVFKAVGEQGANFAFIGNVAQYHTPLDSLVNLSIQSTEHQGDNALAMILALANDDTSNPPEKEAVYFDQFGRHLFEWPASRAPAIGIASALLLAALLALLFWKQRMAPREYLSGLIAFLMALISTAALALVLYGLLRLAGAIPVDWVAHSLPARLAFWLLALAVVLVHGIAFARRARFWGLWLGVWTWWALWGVVISWVQPGTSYLMHVPTCVAMVVGLPIAAFRSESAFAQWIAGILPMVAAATVGFAPLIMLYTAIGVPILPVLAILVAFFLTPLIPLCVDLSGADGLVAVSIPGVPILATGLAAFAAVIVPAYSAQAPERVNLQLWQDADSGKAQWVVEPESGRLPDAIALAASFRIARSGEVPWAHGNAFLSDAPAIELSAPTFTVQDSFIEAGKRHLEALLRSERGAPAAMVMFPPDSGVEGVRMEDVPVPPETSRVRELVNGWLVYRCPAVPPKGVAVSFELPIGKPVVVTVIDHSYGLPDEGAFLAHARPLTAVRSGEGDVTIFSRRVQLNP